MSDPLHVAYVTPEMMPYAKTGGLADVSAALPKALVRLGHRVTVVMPRYASIPVPSGGVPLSISIPLGGSEREVTFRRIRNEAGVDVVFVDHPPFYAREGLYGPFEDNHLRFALLGRSALEYFRGLGERPSVFHAHDWQAGLVPVLLKATCADDPTLRRMASVFTIHNVAYPGQFPRGALGAVGLPTHLEGDFALGYHGGVSYLKGGTVFAEVASTVSPTYAREIQGPEHGAGFEETARSRARDLVGILNGVDYDEWNPSTDDHIAQRYSAGNLAGKAACKKDLLRLFGLVDSPELPLVGVISRLVWQKGFDIVAGAWWDLLRRPVRMIVLGTGEPDIQAGLADLARHDATRFAVRFTYDEGLAHQVMAGSDMFLMPSRSEPCGLTQMYALRYGTVPIVRSTGGLADTVERYDAASGGGTGFRFDHADGTGLVWALDQALAVHGERPAWRELMRRGMAKEFSWERSAGQYVDLYRRAMRMA